jgi:hypothetical protein
VSETGEELVAIVRFLAWGSKVGVYMVAEVIHGNEFTLVNDGPEIALFVRDCYDFCPVIGVCLLLN